MRIIEKGYFFMIFFIFLTGFHQDVFIAVIKVIRGVFD